VEDATLSNKYIFEPEVKGQRMGKEETISQQAMMAVG